MTATRKLALAAGGGSLAASIGACSNNGSSGPQPATRLAAARDPVSQRQARADVPGVRRYHRPDDGRADPGDRPGEHGEELGRLSVAGRRRHPGPHFSFTWYRGSPIGRERKTEELSRTSVEDINIEGHSGFIAVGTDPTLGGDNLCEVGIQFNDDFIEWSVSFAEKPFPPACDVAKELTRQSIVNSK